MSVLWRAARRADVAAIVAMLADDVLGHARESDDLEPYLAAFDALQAEGGNLLIVGEVDGLHPKFDGFDRADPGQADENADDPE